MSDRTRAAELADEIERRAYSDGEHEGFDIQIPFGEEIFSILRARPAPPADVISAIAIAGYVIRPREPTEAMIEAGATAKLNFDRAAAGLQPCSLSDLEQHNIALYKGGALAVIKAALAAEKVVPR